MHTHLNLLHNSQFKESTLYFKFLILEIYIEQEIIIYVII